MVCLADNVYDYLDTEHIDALTNDELDDVLVHYVSLDTDLIDILANYEIGDVLTHYGMPRRSGRYPWGSGENPYQHEAGFTGFVRDLRSQNFTFEDGEGKIFKGDTAIAKSLGMTTTQFRAAYSMAVHEERSQLVANAVALKKDGLSTTEIGRRMGLNESSVRSLLNEDSARRMNQSMVTANYLKDQVDKKGMIDVGVGVETELGVSREKLNEALAVLEMQGYNTFPVSVPQQTNPARQTNMKILCSPDIPYRVNEDGKKISSYPYDNLDKIQSTKDHISYNDGASFVPSFIYPTSVDSSRVQVLLADEPHPKGGVGEDRDGLIEIRPGVKDLSLGSSAYSQVRILVDDNKFLKGMAVYADDLPEGIDIRFNSNKTNREKALKDIDTKNPDNPFGSLIKEHGGQSFYDDPKGKYTDPLTGKKQSLSAINKRADEGDWEEWKKSLPSQFLSKQTEKLAKQQLSLAIANKEDEYATIKSMTNPTVKKRFLESYAENCDYAAEHLQAAPLPKQQYQVLIPVNSLKDNEVYAPNYKDGETVALIRFPHGGTFEIPILKVNNKNEEGVSSMGKQPLDAVGINKRVANRLSGADFDGDTVLVIPCNSPSSKVRINSTHPLEGLKDFDPKMEYGGKEKGTFKPMTESQKQRQMGEVSNLITDMTLKGAPESELARAVRHSMVVIDAVKHELDWQQSEKDNGIQALKKKYQEHIGKDGKVQGGAATIISRAKNEERVLKRQGSPKIDPTTGELIWKTADDAHWIDRETGEVHTRTQSSTQMAETKDAFSLVSEKNTPMERLYATYANKMKAMANRARLESLNTKPIPYNPTAKKEYAKEVKSLDNKLKAAKLNKPREREAQLITTVEMSRKKEAHPEMTKSEIKKQTQQALTRARIKVGAQKDYVTFTSREVEAIQKGAISGSKLADIIANAKDDTLREIFTPRSSQQVTVARQNRIKALASSGYTSEQIAEELGLSTSTIRSYVKEFKEKGMI